MADDVYYDLEDKIHCITYQGKTKTLAAWAFHYEIGPQVLANRLRRGWSFERAINTKVKKRKINRKKKE